MMLRLSLATEDYDRVRAIADRIVNVQGVELETLALEPEELFFRMSRYQDIDIAEFSLSSYTLSVSRGESPFIALPVFLSRVFRHGNILVNRDAGIDHPEKLKGKRIGVPEYQMTAPVWERAILEHEYGVEPGSIEWVTGGQEQPGREERIPWKPPTGISIEPARSGKSLTEMLLEGELDGMLCARLPSAFDKGDPRIQRLFPDFKSVEKQYYEKTGLFPIMHTMVMRKDLYNEHPWLAPELVKAFQKAKEIAEKNLFEMAALKTMLPWLVAEAEEEREFFQGNLWPYGVEENRKTLEAFLQYHYEQGLSERLVEVDELFAPNTVEQSAI
ncbi:ABC transporter substrate-binding protein [Salicibibacter cibarius]|uniref:ABC transporter substrate-binding protein n=1 Tax=Salicibibacter cibarius TaxID=2743000 RepID=A0A7T6Z0W3_9BACI|nr:ABC transporter substrate-binding protein [Salicibibacter cibarius]QQK74738.1 ABC transporter substrate-binding protein [Salicibibacter cibarius]